MDLMSYLLGKNSGGGGGGSITDYISDTLNFSTSQGSNFCKLVQKLPKMKISSNVTQLMYAFQNYQGTKIEFDFENSDFSKVINMSYMFNECVNLREIDMSGFISNNKITTMSMAFGGCSELRKVDISGISVTQTANINTLFYNCKKLAVIDISGLTNPIIIASYYQDMFYNCGTECLQSDGAYADGIPYIYVHNATMQNFILNTTTHPEDWTTANVVIKE